MKTTQQSRHMLIERHSAARAVPIEADGHALLERKSKKPLGIISATTHQLAAARARYMARAYTMAPYLVKDIEELKERLDRVQSLLAQSADLIKSEPLFEQLMRLSKLETEKSVTADTAEISASK